MRSILILLVLAVTLAGCRREDIRTVRIELPELKAEQRQTVIEALNQFNGVMKNSYEWDEQNGAVTLKYDSMQVAQTNLRMAIEEKGIKVRYPVNDSGIAGYVDQTEK